MKQNLLALLAVVMVVSVECQMLHSIDRMSEVVGNQAALADHLERYITEQEETLKIISKWAEKLRTDSVVRRMVKSDLEVKMSHPVRVLRFISDIYYNVYNVKSLLDLSRISSAMKEAFAKLPNREEYVAAVQAVVRLQEVYGKAADFTVPQEGNTEDVLKADEVFEMAKVCLKDENYASALKNFKRAKEMFEETSNIPMAMESYENLASVMNKQGNPAYALNYTYELLDYYKDRDAFMVIKLEENMKSYIESLGGDKQAEYAVQLGVPYQNPRSYQYNDEYKNYNELCRGETVKTAYTDKEPLKCHLHTNNNHPLLVLSPARREDLNLKTGLSFFHDVLTERQIRLLQRVASEKFVDSTLTVSEEVLNNPDIEKKDEGSYADFKARSSNTGWVHDGDDTGILAISKRVSAIIGLSLDSAESFQVLSYGIGGFYLPHYDWGYGENPFDFFPGNRIATWIFYLNDIKKGGATVFPDIGAAVWPEKGGAAFWRNLYRNGSVDPLTIHAACPVLEGYKWASNKWFHTVGNELSWPCDVNPEV